MDQPKHLENIYTAIRDFIQQHRQHKVAVRLQYLMTKGCWNSWAELLEAVDEVLAELATTKDVTGGTGEMDIVRVAKDIRKAIACLLARRNQGTQYLNQKKSEKGSSLDFFIKKKGS